MKSFVEIELSKELKFIYEGRNCFISEILKIIGFTFFVYYFDDFEYKEYMGCLVITNNTVYFANIDFDNYNYIMKKINNFMEIE